MSSPTNNWKYRRIEHCFYVEIVTNITTRNSERKDTTMTTQKKPIKMNNTDPTKKPGVKVSGLYRYHCNKSRY